jgi:hypothetical protein
MSRGCLWAAIQIALLILLAEGREARCEASPLPIPATGLITKRLSAKELERWKEIEQVVFAEDANLQPLHPTLRGLWEWIETSGHIVYVEIARTSIVSTCTAGHFLIEQFDPSGESHIAVIKLNLTNINQAYVGPETRRFNGFIPFLGLDKDERYAEVLGHELAHAVHILTSLERTRQMEEIVQKTNQMLLSQHPRHKSGGLAPELKRRLSKRDALLQKLEAQAEDMEKIIWIELTARKLALQSERQRLLNLAAKP